MTTFDAKIIDLECITTCDNPVDDVKMQIDGVKRWPPGGDPESFVKFVKFAKIPVNMRFTFQGDAMTVALFGDESGPFTPDDRLGSTTLFASDRGIQTKDLEGDDESHYKLTYKVLEIPD